MAGRIQLDVSMGELRIKHHPVDAAQAEIFQIPVGSDVIKVSRIILAEMRPVAFLIDEIAADLFSSEDLHNGFTGSVLDLMLNRGDFNLSTSVAEIKAVAAPAEIARAMQIQRGDVLLQMSSQLYDINSRVVDISQSYFLPGYFRFHVVRRVEGNQ